MQPKPTRVWPAARRPLAHGLEEDVVCKVHHVQLALVVPLQRLDALCAGGRREGTGRAQ